MKVIFHQKNYDLILKFLLFITAFSIPFSFAFNSISLAILFLFSFVFFKKENFFSNLNIKKVYIFYILFFIMQALSIYYALNKDAAIKSVTRNVVFFILPIAFINLKNKIDKNNIKTVYYGLLLAILSTLVSTYFNIIRQYLFENISIKTMVREKFVANGIYDIHVPYIAILIVFLIICTYKIKFHRKEYVDKMIKISLMTFLSLSLLQLSGVMSIVILALYFFIQFLYSKRSNKVKITGVFLMSIVFIFSYLMLKNIDIQDRVRGSENLIYRTQRIIKSSDQVRNENWESVINVISSNLFLGVSADGGLELLQGQRQILSEAYINKHNAHNDYLEIILRYGLIGFSIYLLLIGILLRKAVLAKNYFLIWFLVVFLISGLTESYLQRQIGIVFFVFFSLLFYTQNESERFKINQKEI